MPLTLLLHDLALLYLALAHGADGELDTAEQASMRDQLRAWAPGTDPALCDHALREAGLSYGNGVGKEKMDDLLQRLHDGLDPDGRARVLADLMELARADDVVEPGETALIDRVAAAWAT
ncbi:MAG: TerB family tellurite resistance protein [Rhodothermales bacterium]